MPGTVPAPAPVPLEENPPVLDEKPSSDGEASSSSAAGLSEEEKNIIQRQLDAPNATVGYFSLFRYANKKEMLIMFVSFWASVVAGACMPLMTVGLTRNKLIEPSDACVAGVR